MTGPEVEVWWAGVDEARDEFVRDLDAIERGRLAAYRHDVDKARFLLGVTIVRQVLARRLSLPAASIALDRTCPDCGRPHGKVRLRGDGDDRDGNSNSAVEMSVTHSGRLVGVAFADRPVGLDVEKVDPDVDVDAVARIALSAAETRELARYDGIERARAFTTYWTRKEAVVKATGEGLRGDLTAAVPDGIQVVRLDVGADHRAALAVLSAGEPVVRTFRFGADLRR